MRSLNRIVSQRGILKVDLKSLIKVFNHQINLELERV